MIRTSLCFAVALAVVSTALPCAADTAEPTPAAPASLAEALTGMARAEYEAGRILFVDGDYQGSRLKFERAYELSQDPRLLWNIAACEKNLRNYAKVISALRKYQKDGASMLSEEDRVDAERLIETVAAFVATVNFDVQPAGTRIRVDGVDVGRSPLPEPVLLDQGDREIWLSKPGYVELRERRRVAGGAEAKLSFALEAEKKEGRLRVVAGAGDSISVDGRVVGRGTWEGSLPAGVHTVHVTGSGKRPYQTDVVVQVGQTHSARVSLESEAKEPGFWGSPWPWVVGGAVVATGVGVGAYFALRPESEGPPPVVPGTLGSVALPLRF